MTKENRYDFSIWHPLDHWPGTRRCRSFYGGWRRHLVIAWQFHRRDQVVGLFTKQTTCRLGYHKIDVWVLTSTPIGSQPLPTDRFTAVCRYCRTRRPATRQEIAEKWKVET